MSLGITKTEVLFNYSDKTKEKHKNIKFQDHWTEVGITSIKRNWQSHKQIFPANGLIRVICFTKINIVVPEMPR